MPPKSRKMNVPTAGGEILFSVAPNTQFIPVHAAAEGLEYVRQPEIDHEKLLQQLRTKIIQRQEQEMDQSQSPSYMDGKLVNISILH